MPALAWIAIGTGKLWPIPVPIFLLWPVIWLALAATGLARAAYRRPGSIGLMLASANQALLAIGQLRGLAVDIQGSDGTRIFIRVV